jgi:hypothetical protein
MLLWAHEYMDLEVALVHLEQVQQGYQGDQVSMSLDWCSAWSISNVPCLVQFSLNQRLEFLLKPENVE